MQTKQVTDMIKTLNKCKVWAVLSVLLVLTGCVPSADDSLFEKKYAANFKEMIGGEIDEAQTWITGAVVNANVKTSGKAIVSVYTLGKEERVLYARKEVNGSRSFRFAIPQNLDEHIAFEADYGDAEKVYRKMDLNLNLEQSISLDLTRPATTRATMASSNSNTNPPSSLCGNSNSSTAGGYAGHNFGYTQFPGWTWDNLAEAIPEGEDPNGKQITNYELISTGPFYLSLIYGFTGTTTSTVLGYYYYQTSGVYTDLVMVDLCEVLKYDYIDGYAKTQFQLIGESSWTDTNFDHWDGEGDDGITAKVAARQGDGIRCTFRDNKRYGGVNGIQGVRGLTFQINVPVGYRLGFDLKAGSKQTSQVDNLKALGVPESCYNISQGLCFSGADLNTRVSKYPFRSVIKKYDGFTFMGLDDSPGGGDYDCNDVSFGLTAGNGGSLPGVLLPGVKDLDNDVYYNNDGTLTDEPKDEAVKNVIEGRDPFDNGPTTPDPVPGEGEGSGESPSTGTDLLPWTIGYEDLGMNGDFDFNDIVLKVIPTTANKAKVYLCATGGTYPAQIYYDGPNGVEDLGDAHTLLGQMVNTKGMSKAPKLIATVDWPDGYTMPTDAHRFYIVVKGEKISVGRGPYGEPKAICVQGNWQWPKEMVSLANAYPTLSQWATNIDDPSARDWYNHPTSGNVIVP